MTARVRPLFLVFVVSASFATLVLLLAELGLRMTYPEKVLEIAEDRRRVQNLAYIPHPDYLVALAPNTERTFRRPAEDGGQSVAWQTNSEGFRGGPLRDHPAVRIIVYGDSNIEAKFSRWEDTFTYRLEQHLAALSSIDIEVINAGIAGAGPDQSLIRFAAQFAKYKPDLVVFHVLADNDFGDIVRNRLFTLDSQNELARTTFRPTIDDAFESRLPRLLLARAGHRLINLLTGTASAPLEAIRPPDVTLSVLAEVTEAENAIYRRGAPRAFSHFADHYDIDISLQPRGDSSQIKMALMEGVLRRAKEIATEKHTNFLVLIQPSPVDLIKRRDVLSSFHLSRFPEYRPDRLSTIIDTICAEYGIDRVNLYPIFSLNNPDSLSFKKDVDHWNDAGQDLAARVAAQHIHAADPTLGRR